MARKWTSARQYRVSRDRGACCRHAAEVFKGIKLEDKGNVRKAAWSSESDAGEDWRQYAVDGAETVKRDVRTCQAGWGGRMGDGDEAKFRRGATCKILEGAKKGEG